MSTLAHPTSRKSTGPEIKAGSPLFARPPGRLIAAGTNARTSTATIATARESASNTGPGTSFAQVPVSSHEPLPPAAVQFKLRVGSSSDPMEREADQIANRIMGMPRPSGKGVARAVAGASAAASRGKQTACTACAEEEEAARGKRLPDDDETVGAKLKGPPSRITSGHEQQIRRLSGGQRLPTAERNYFERRFGHDFSRVQLHTDSAAQSSANSLNARAYTHRNNIVFGSGQYAPGTSSGRWLMAHELAHVVQQTASGKPDVVQRDLATPLPTEAVEPQRELSESDIDDAIKFNNRRYNKQGIELIQDLVGTKPTGTLVKADILAIARIQEEYGLKKDGMVGTKMFKFLDEELKAEKVSREDKHCLTSLNIRKRAENIVPRANGAIMTRQFFMDAQLPSHCGCKDYEYRQFIRGHFTHERAGVVTDEGDWFGFLPAGRLNAAWQEDGHTGAAALNYGHRTQPAEAINRYLNDAFNLDMDNGCLYRGEDTPGGDYSGWNVAAPTTGDILDIDVNFRGEIQRKGRVVRQKFWTALKRRFALP